MMHQADLDFTAMAETFYASLFERMPALEAKFGDKDKQYLMFIVALQSIENSAQGDKQLADYMKMMGEKHRSYGLTAKDMRAGREAFIDAVEAGGSGLSDERRELYIGAFEALEKAMGFCMGEGCEDED